MSLIMFEGFETHSALTDLQSYGGFRINNTQTLLTSGDANGISPRLSGSGCWKGTSTGTVAWNTSFGAYSAQNYWPLALLRPPTYQPAPSGTTCIFGFAFYPKLTGEQAWSETTAGAAFTPLVALCNNNTTTPSPHLFFGINSNLNLVAYRFNQTSYPNKAYNEGPVSYGCSEYGNFTHYGHPYAESTCSVNSVLTIPQVTGTAKFNLLGTSTISIADAQWNYIEIKVVMRNNNTGSIQAKINRVKTDATLDLNLSNIQTTTASTNVIGSIAFGQWMGFVSNMTNQRSSGLGSIGMVTYYDDFYWCDENGATFNDFQGPIIVRTKQVNTVTSNTFATRVGASDVAAIGGKISSSSTSDYLQSNAKNQSVIFRVTQPSENNVLAAQLHAIGAEIQSATSEFHMSANYNGSGITRLNETLVNPENTRGFNLLLPTAPDGTSWTPEKIASTDFKLEHL